MINVLLETLWPRLVAGLLPAAIMLASPHAYGGDPSGPLVTVQGRLTVRVIENLNHQPPAMALERFLRDDGGVMRRLEFNGPPPENMRAGERVTVQGYVDGDLLRVQTIALPDQAPTLTVRSTASKSYSTESGPAPADQPPAPTIGERRAVVLIVDLLDAKVSDQFPDVKRQVIDVMYAGSPSVDSLYRDSSQNQLYFKPDTNGDGQPDVFGPFPINSYAAQGCDYMNWATAAEAAATAAGVDLNLYQHRVFVLPRYDKLPRCGWSGVSEVGCDASCRSWIAEAESAMAYAHELGHNLNLAHAGLDPENDGVFNDFYGDYSTPMGGGRKWRRFHAPNVDQLGWYAPYPGGIVTVTANGVYSIAPLGTSPAAGAPLMLKLRKADTNEYYYLSYRQAVGMDCVADSSCINSSYTTGVNIHRYVGRGFKETAFIRALSDGEIFTDNANAITVAQLGHSDNLVTVNVTLCDARDPVVSLTPSSRVVQPGALAGYDATVANQDANADCRTDFTLSYSGPGSGVLTPELLNLGGGQSGGATLRVDTAGLADGVYTTLNAQAADNDAKPPVHLKPGSGAATLIVDGTPPTAPTGLSGVANPQGTAITLNWAAAADALSGVQSYRVYRNGVAVSGDIDALSYPDTTTVKGVIYTYTVAAQDGAGNSSPLSKPLTMIGGCAVQTPLVSLSPSKQAVKPGGTAAYTARIANADAADCPRTAFTVIYTGPAGGSLSPNPLTLNGGQSGAVILQAPTNATGAYSLSVQAVDNDGVIPSHDVGVSGSVTLQVDGAAPTTPTGLRGAPTPQGRVSLYWSGAVDALAGVAYYKVYRNGAAIGQTVNLFYQDAGAALNATHQYTVSAVDNAGNESPPSAGVSVYNGCLAAAPVVSLTPPSQIAQPNLTASYTVTVGNQDNSGCAATTFTLSSVGTPAGSLNPTTLTLSGGQSRSAALLIGGAAEGGFTPAVRVADNDGYSPSHEAVTVSAGLIVDGAPPTAPANLQATIDAQNQVVLSWTAAVDAGAGVASYTAQRDGVTLGQTTALSYTDSAAVVGKKYTYTVTATDRAGNASPPSTAVTVTVGCIAADPTVTLTPASQAMKLKTVATYTVSVVNNDSGGCPSTSFTLSSAVSPAGPKLTLTPTSLILGAGQTGAAMLTTSYDRAGGFSLNVQAADSDNRPPAHATVSGGGAFITDNVAPSAPTNPQAASTAQGQITLSWSAAADNAGGSGVGGYLVKRGGAQVGETTATSYSETIAVGTAVSYTVAAKDKAGNVSAYSTAATAVSGCVTATPTVTLTPASQMAKLNAAVNYAVTVGNQDGANCPATTFTLGFISAPTGPTGVFSPAATLRLTPGQSGAATLQAKSGSSAIYAIQVKAADNDGAAPSHVAALGGAGFVTDGAAPTIPTNLQAVVAPGKVALTWSPSTDVLAGVHSYLVYRGGAVVAETTTPSYTDAAVAQGAKYSYKVAAKDKVGNVSTPSAAITVTAQ